LNEANIPAGGKVTKTELAAFLVKKAQLQALLNMIGGLTELPA